MLLQGNLQRVFDALYRLGIIDPVLQLDWAEELKQIGQFHPEVEDAVRVVNTFQCDAAQLADQLKRFDPKILNYLAMEVAREYAEFHARNLLH